MNGTFPLQITLVSSSSSILLIKNTYYYQSWGPYFSYFFRIDESGFMPGDPNLGHASGANGSDQKSGNMQETTFQLDGHPPEETKPNENRPTIDSKPSIRVRNPPGGKSSIFF